MKVCYDLHIHSALSPCADNDMTPINIVAKASAAGLEMIAVADHNQISNVKATMNIGRILGVTVVPAMELQTTEDIHFLCLFENFDDLENFYNSIDFLTIKNNTEIYGDQLIINEKDEITGIELRLLSVSSNVNEYEIYEKVKKYNGIAIPAHINRDMNGIVNTLGEVPDTYKIVELSNECEDETIQKYSEKYKVIVDSDSHCLESIGKKHNIIEIKNNTSKALLKCLYGDIK